MVSWLLVKFSREKDTKCNTSSSAKSKDKATFGIHVICTHTEDYSKSFRNFRQKKPYKHAEKTGHRNVSRLLDEQAKKYHGYYYKNKITWKSLFSRIETVTQFPCFALWTSMHKAMAPPLRRAWNPPQYALQKIYDKNHKCSCLK